FDPVSDTGFIKRAPREFLPRILLARRRNIRMGQDADRGNRVAGLDAPAERRYCRDLAFRKIRIAVIVPRIGDFDSDRAGIDISLAGPLRFAGVPGTTAFRNYLHDPAVLEDEIVR